MPLARVHDVPARPPRDLIGAAAFYSATLRGSVWSSPRTGDPERLRASILGTLRDLQTRGLVPAAFTWSELSQLAVQAVEVKHGEVRAEVDTASLTLAKRWVA